MHADHPIVDYMALMGEGAQLIDVREVDEFASGSLPEAVNMPLSEFADRAAELDSERRVVLFCKAGGRSTQAAEFLTASGFGDVYNLEGGMMAWSKASGSSGSSSFLDRFRS